MPDYGEVPERVITRLRKICLALPETHEEKAWVGTRWCIRKRNFAHVLSIDDVVVVVFRSEQPELEMLRNAGHPFFYAGWGRDVIGLVIDAKTDWQEVAELMSDSYCVMAPKNLRAAVEGV